MIEASITTDTSRFERVCDALDAAMDKPADGAGPVADGMMEAGRAYLDEMSRRFNKASDPADSTWPQLAPSTVSQKAKKTLFPTRKLYLTGALFRSLTPDNPDNILEPHGDRVRAGTRNFTATFHQTGRPSRHLPARPIVVAVTQDALKRCTAPIVDGWREQIANVCT